MYSDTRGASSVIGVILMVSVAVIIAATTAAYFTGLTEDQTPAPQVSVSHTLVDDGGDQTIAVTLDSASRVETDHLYVTASTDLDIGGAPGSSTPADEAYSSSLEKFTESSGGNPPQVGIGDTWDAGETVYLDPDGSAQGVTVRIYWSAKPVQGVNPGTVQSADAYKIVEFTV
jgi:FlaG/FlaF family flagellin (archaellin)